MGNTSVLSWASFSLDSDVGCRKGMSISEEKLVCVLACLMQFGLCKYLLETASDKCKRDGARKRTGLRGSRMSVLVSGIQPNRHCRTVVTSCMRSSPCFDTLAIVRPIDALIRKRPYSGLRIQPISYTLFHLVRSPVGPAHFRRRLALSF